MAKNTSKGTRGGQVNDHPWVQYLRDQDLSISLGAPGGQKQMHNGLMWFNGLGV